MELFRMSILHMKLFRINWEAFGNIEQVDGVDQEQVGGHGVELQVHRVVQDAHQTNKDEVKSILRSIFMDEFPHSGIRLVF
jgi:anti-sigma factor ChrR (cupin superfamily)